jgi:undecaprenyl-diphosphatase
VFTIMIQPGAVLAVMWLYRARLVEVVAGLPSSREAQRFALMVLAAFLPAVLIGAVLSDFVRTVLHQSAGVMASAFVAGGIVMLLVERYRPEPIVRDAERTPLTQAVAIGLFQTLALVPGVSRAGATIVGGMLVGLDRRAAAEFSFFLAMPTMVAAFLHDLWEYRDVIAAGRTLEIAIGFVTAFAAAAMVVKPFLSFVSRSGFGVFAWYRIGAGLVLFALLAAGWSF